MLYLLIAVVLTIAAAGSFYWAIMRPTLSKLEGALSLLMERGSVHGWVEFVHVQTARRLKFIKETNGNVNTVALSIDGLGLTNDQRTALEQFVQSNKLTVCEIRMGKQSTNAIVLGSSPALSASLAIEIAMGIMGLPPRARFAYFTSGVKLERDGPR